MNLFKKIFNKLSFLWCRRNGKAYICYLRKMGVKVGERCDAVRPFSLDIDVSRPTLLTIGNHVFLHKGLTIMTHDWASWVFVEKYNDFIPSHSKVVIGNNIWFGENVTVLKGVTIGDNCIIGAGSIVTKSIPANSVAVGVPARVVTSLDEYYKKRKLKYPQEAFEFARSLPSAKIEDFYDDYVLFVDKENISEYKKYPYLRVFENDERLEKWLASHKRVFNDFEEFYKSTKENETKDKCNNSNI